MNSKNEARKIKLEHWAAIIHECMNSGMKVRDWCAQNQISKDTYYYWFKEVRKAAITHNNEKLQHPALSFVEVPDAVPASAGAAGNASVTIRLENAVVEVTDHTSPETLRMVLGVLANA